LIGKAALLLLILTRIACTQKNPMDPAGSIGERVSFLVDIAAAPNQIMTGGQKSSVQTRLIDENGTPVANGSVSFQTTLGSLNPLSTTTDANGWAKTELASGIKAGDAVVTARYSSYSTKSVTVTIKDIADTSGFTLQLEADKAEVLANGVSSTELTVRLIPNGSQSPAGKLVRLTVSAGSIDRTTLVLDETGESLVTFTSAARTKDDTATVVALYGTLSTSSQIRLKGIQFIVEANPLAVFADGSSSSAVRASLKETTTGIGLPAETVRFGTDLGSIQAEEKTDDFGVASVQLVTGTQPGTATVVARYGQILLDTVLVEFRRPAYTAELSVSPKSLLANGLDAGSVSATVRDESGKPMVDQAVFFSATAGGIDYVQNTNASGVATAMLVSAASVSDVTSTVRITVKETSKTTQVLFRGVQFTVSADPNYIEADGTSQSTVMAEVRETTTKVGIDKAQIQFGTNLGTISGNVETDTRGVAQTLMTSSKTAGIAQVIGRYGNLLLDTVFVQFGPHTPPSLYSIQANPGFILANGMDQAMVSVKVVDGNSSPVAMAAVNFTATSGVITPQDLTDANGVATVSLVSIESLTDIVSTVTARIGEQTASTQVTFEGIQMSVNAAPTAVLADGHSTSTILVILKRTTSKIAVANATVQFASDLGTIPASAVTNSEGVAQVMLTSSTSIGTAHVSVLYGTSIKGNVSVSFQESVPTFLEGNSTPPVLPADGQSQSVIKAIVSDANRNPVPDGTIVLFELVSGTGSLERQKSTSNGIATTTLTAGTRPGTATVRISVGSLTRDVQITYTVGEVYQVLVTSDRETMPADGIAVANIRVHVVDGQGNPVSGRTVFFTTSIGDITPTAPTDASGYATARFSSGVVGTAAITATVRKADELLVTGTMIIQLLPGTSNSINLRVDPNWMGVKDTGQNQTVRIYADVKDSKNNPVEDGTVVLFKFMGDSLDAVLSSNGPIPTVAGTSQVSMSSGYRSGSVRVQATVINSQRQAVTAVSTRIIIHAGPPFIEDISDVKTSHLRVEAARLNIFRSDNAERVLSDTTAVYVRVTDRFNNPVEAGQAVYFTASGGAVSTHTAYTNEYGIARVQLDAGGNPGPTIDRFYNYNDMQDPNSKTLIPGPQWFPDLQQYLIPNFDGDWNMNYPGSLNGTILNSEGNMLQNDGVARIMARTVGVDAGGQTVHVWDWMSVVMSEPAGYADNSYYVFHTLFGDTLHTGQSAVVTFVLMDKNGNPIESKTEFKANIVPAGAQAAVSWTQARTGVGWGSCFYSIGLINQIDPEKPKPGAAAIHLEWEAPHQFGSVTTSTIFIAR
jgi:adhesin/invasin